MVGKQCQNKAILKCKKISCWIINYIYYLPTLSVCFSSIKANSFLILLNTWSLICWSKLLSFPTSLDFTASIVSFKILMNRLISKNVMKIQNEKKANRLIAESSLSESVLSFAIETDELIMESMAAYIFL